MNSPSSISSSVLPVFFRCNKKIFLMNKTYSKSCFARGSLLEVFCKCCIQENYVLFTGKHPCGTLFFNKLTVLTSTFGFRSNSFRSSRLQNCSETFNKSNRTSLVKEFSFNEIGDCNFTRK